MRRIERSAARAPAAANPIGPTPFTELNHVLGELVSRIRAILGRELIGVYLQGSFAVGDFDEHSDVDFIVAIEAEMESHLVDALQAMHGEVYELESTWARHLEGSYFPRDVLRQPPVSGSTLWYLDNGARQLIRSDHCNTLVVRRVVHDQGIALSGPPPDTLVATVSDELLRAEIYETLTRWGREIVGDPASYRNRFYQGFIVLSYCRMLHDLRRGRPGTKREGTEWAKSALDPSWADLIDSAWSTRPDPARGVRTPADAEAFERTLRFVEYVIRDAETTFGGAPASRPNAVPSRFGGDVDGDGGARSR